MRINQILTFSVLSLFVLTFQIAFSFDEESFDSARSEKMYYANFGLGSFRAAATWAKKDSSKFREAVDRFYEENKRNDKIWEALSIRKTLLHFDFSSPKISSPLRTASITVEVACYKRDMGRLIRLRSKLQTKLELFAAATFPHADSSDIVFSKGFQIYLKDSIFAEGIQSIEIHSYCYEKMNTTTLQNLKDAIWPPKGTVKKMPALYP